LFNGGEVLRIVAQSIGRERSQPEGELGCLSGELLQPWSPNDGSDPSITIVHFMDT
jgi:hypothetical protein